MMRFPGLQTALIKAAVILIVAVTAADAQNTKAAGCPEQCGNVSIPFPFGMGEGCYLNTNFSVNCIQTAEGETVAYWIKIGEIITNISVIRGESTIMQNIARDCYNRSGGRVKYNNPSIRLPMFAAVSNTANKFFVAGCYTTGSLSGWQFDQFQRSRYYRSGCTASCAGEDDVENGTCIWLGCCSTAIPTNLYFLDINMERSNNETEVTDFNECGYAFVVEEKSFAFSLEKLASLRSVRKVPMVVDWVVGVGNCAEAKANPTTYGCVSLNSECYDVDNGFGYRCNCTQGYHGNPYLLGDAGCRDTNECEDESLHNCSKPEYCKNINATFSCACPNGYIGDPLKGGGGCYAIQSKSESNLLRLATGISLGIIVLLLSASWFYFVLQNRRLVKMRQHYFHQNGGMLLQQKLHGRERSPDLAKIYSEIDLKKATNNFHHSMIIGEGGYGTVYQGFLHGDGGVVAIKKAKQVPKQIDQFTNEVIVLSQIKHKNVVKLLGCCLETEFPLLVYEFISNGTLSNHVHNEAKSRSFSWDSRLRIAAEVASVLSYLHSDAASTPIIHRDVKCENILLDHAFTAKVSDFGASRLVPLDPSELSTMVQGTFGYLDPEYMQTSQLNEKSDVYSFGVVLAELLTGMRALSYDRPEEERNLAHLFVMKKGRDLLEIFEDNVVREGSEEELMKVSALARSCLRVRGEERPSMREVAMELEGVRGGGGKHAWIRTEYVEEDKESLLGKRALDGFMSGGGGKCSSSFGLDSLGEDCVLPLHGGR